LLDDFKDVPHHLAHVDETLPKQHDSSAAPQRPKFNKTAEILVTGY
jgi:hypothetical protein